ncbi:MAG TPA: 1-(5-phosphoribosyl)-5-[(5-phosphoribosylamino)methylideneamino]imidazole-4-carboxamide isomerase [Peptococcaceae bacterium]|jgi:phosphoribosylformimino-5-aminoimidazole carboxamide ribotide isomerase|nr:1-(5-phosphoribosyl)-5-[(5-phosphoribosylamino)methylideneamino]imidazole-4-carboxamide isomerase [Clostridia bacterium]HOB82206.1 1-(5-phosphoribosyl)-5-[(5-phosphoribosylamino)methylideneamino]imidazole-4-carboxamide isomerase [Peptococcaceae bacterium]HPZ70919.1 1-(5-phosphoribosyl)-5-[(5-phosphoribosylamino)methylideneamino]imidazole-4-carboxamide isomerase [Peptococcaceae bacterium]HQD54107.1 1-(5-phosphoribosyl)-5-[(5-phosphoribosylamino)methylideneamino]imidazole-4-carboxamide isomeras
MLVIPAIDLRDGRCVRLVQGEKSSEIVYSEQPVEVAKMWESIGAPRLHLVDLDGAFAGRPKNLGIVQEILQAIKIPVQMGGGIRTFEAVEMILNMGVDRVILGTAAILSPELVAKCTQEFGEHVAVGIDSRDGLVAIEGWEATVEMTVFELGKKISSLGVERVIFTDTRRDGTLQGPNLEATKKLAETTGLKVIASGGVSSLEDLQQLKELESSGVEGIIMGKALYSGAVDLKDALQLMEAPRV